MGAVAVKQAFRALEATYPRLRDYQGSAKIRELAYLLKDGMELKTALNLVQDRETRRLIADRLKRLVAFDVPELD